MFRFDGQHRRCEELKSRNLNVANLRTNRRIYPLFFYFNLRNILLAGCNTAEYSNTFNTVAKLRNILNDA